MAWHQIGDKQLTEPLMTQSADVYEWLDLKCWDNVIWRLFSYSIVFQSSVKVISIVMISILWLPVDKA